MLLESDVQHHDGQDRDQHPRREWPDVDRPPPEEEVEPGREGGSARSAGTPGTKSHGADGWRSIWSSTSTWRPVHPDQIIYLFDYGQPWCQERSGHPQYQPSGYPSITHHPTECQSYGGWFDGWFEDARAGLNGPPGLLFAYLVWPYRFGQRHWRQDDDTRLAMEFAPRSEGAAEPFRCSIPVESIRNLARHLNLTADVGDGWREPRPIRQALTD